MSSESEEWELDAAVEQQLSFLRGDGPAPDLSSLTPDQVAEVEEILEIVESIVDASPGVPRIEDDPVARRLGLLSPQPVVIDAVDAAIHEAAHRFPAVVALRSEESAIVGFDGRYVCRTLAETIGVVVIPMGNRASLVALARRLFAETEELSAVAFTSEDAQGATVVSFAESHRVLDPALGWGSGDPENERDPLGVALGRYLDRSTPRWDEVSRLDPAVTLEGLDDHVDDLVQVSLVKLDKSSPKLGHKRHAREFVLGCPTDRLVDWAVRVRAKTLSGTDLAVEIRDYVLEAAA